jgi:glycosyltransferase involved in cell wall biosynthesis
MTSILSAELPTSSDADFASVRRLDDWGPLRTRYTVQLMMPAWERAIGPEVCFAPGGPVYWRARARQVVLFALPHLIYPERDIFRGLRRRERWRLQALLAAARRSFKQADALVVETETVRERVQRFLDFPRERIFLVRNSYSPAFARCTREADRRPNHDRFVVLVPSAFYAHKNLECVVEVAREIKRRGVGEVEFRLTLPQSSRAWWAITSRAQVAGVASMVRSVGAIPHAKLAEEYRDADLVFLPTLLECSTAVYPEAFLAGVPVVTSNLDFAQELCGDGARYVDPFAPTAMAEAIIDLVRDSGSRQALIEAGRRALATGYWTPDEKWQAQLACMEQTR